MLCQGSSGLEAVMCITKEFDATRANVVCSGRKAILGRNGKVTIFRVCISQLRITFVFSYLFFPKPFNNFHALLGTER